MKSTRKHISILSIITLIILPFILSNCETVMDDFELRTSDPKIVIEGSCSSLTDSAIVKLSKTANYMNPVEFPSISGAIVMISFNDTTIILHEDSPGFYCYAYNFPENTEYNLSVTIEGKTYTATSFMPNAVHLTNLTYNYSIYSPYYATYPGEKFYAAHMEFLDPKPTENYYRIKVTKNDTLYNGAYDIIVTDDKYFGKDTIPYEPNYVFQSKDTVEFEFQSIDKANYLYYTTLLLAMNSSGNFSVPDNPTSNISGGVLGNFIAFSSDTASFIIP